MKVDLIAQSEDAPFATLTVTRRQLALLRMLVGGTSVSTMEAEMEPSRFGLSRPELQPLIDSIHSPLVKALGR